MNPASVVSYELHQHLGARLLGDGRTRFCVWSPTTDQVELIHVDRNESHELTKLDSGYHVLDAESIGAGQRYFFRFDGGMKLPDPASRFQPEGVHGPSAVVEHRFEWSDQSWKGVQREDLIIYELHVGTFTADGTFRATIERLDELVDLGVTAIELMPVADAAGRWNWGYDGVNLFAPNRNYGTPDDLRKLVDEAHARGIAVLLDVVYNHLGPEGNYLGQSGPYLSTQHSTVWGSAPNFDNPLHGRELRRFFVANAIYWMDEFHIDGLRVDAIHCMRDESDRHVAVEISEAVKEWSRHAGRPVLMIAESNVYDRNMLASIKDGGVGFDALWCDDFLHSVFAVLRPGEQLCQRTYESHTDLDQTLRMGFVYEGSLYEQRARKSLGKRVDMRGLIYSIQHHDFIGNHPLGKRLHQLTSLETQKAAAALLILSPAIPMLFMGEEFACERPFQFFVDFGDDHLQQSVVEGRKREYPQHDWSDGILPTEPDAFLDSKIGPASDGNTGLRKWYKSLISLRKQMRASEMLQADNLMVDTDLEAGLFLLRYQCDSQSMTVAVRLTSAGTKSDEITVDAGGTLHLDSSDQPTPDRVFRSNHAKVFIE